ncbi:MAG: translation initiation factor IF-3 [Candidatus Latescibacterota bacterium]|nr:translation initiation factor IF-3 [Candidatus Latescibacterota bacterium]
MRNEEAAIARQQQTFTRINDSIRVPQVRLIDAEGGQAGVIDTSQAMEMAEEADLDLVEVAPEARPPVCRIMDYGKYRYDKEKKAKEARKKQHNVQMKTVRIRTANISEHDLEYRLGHIREFIGHGIRVKVSMRFLGRMMAYKDRGREVMSDVAKQLEDIAIVDQMPQMEGREMSMILRPV